jgi:hypothetical protein
MDGRDRLMEEEEDRPTEGMNNTAASMAGGEESRRRNPIGRFRPSFDMRHHTNEKLDANSPR